MWRAGRAALRDHADDAAVQRQHAPEEEEGSVAAGCLQRDEDCSLGHHAQPRRGPRDAAARRGKRAGGRRR